MIRRLPPFRPLLVALVALAVAQLGFGHALRAQAPLDPQLAAYVMAGGSLADLCLTGDADAPVAGFDCPDCTLCKALALAAPPAPAPTRAARPASFSAPSAGVPPADVATRGPPVRAPPAALA